MAGYGDCDTCSNFVYDDESECYECMVSMDEDDYGRLMVDSRFQCPYYSEDNEYAIVRKQN
ncbi:MAG: DUF6472 family protein [Lachnospiraceae bacterium]|nr:DUF6472 family protein [Lachnospiraceae bacterium]